MSTPPTRGFFNRTLRFSNPFADTPTNASSSSSSRPPVLRERNAGLQSPRSTGPLGSPPSPTCIIPESAIDIDRASSPGCGNNTRLLRVDAEANPSTPVTRDDEEDDSGSYRALTALFGSQTIRYEEAPPIAGPSRSGESPPTALPWRPSELPAGSRMSSPKESDHFQQSQMPWRPSELPARPSTPQPQDAGGEGSSRDTTPQPQESEKEGASSTTTPTDESSSQTSSSSDSTPTGAPDGESQIVETLVSLPPRPPLLPSTIFDEAVNLPLLPRFTYLLRRATTIMETNGPYGLDDSNHLIREPQPMWDSTELRFHNNLAVAQDALQHPQPEGPCLEDLRVLCYLWSTGIHCLNQITATHILDLEVFAWGVFGLTAGYISPDDLAQSHRTRLHTALTSLPELRRPSSGRTLEAAERADRLIRANRAIHICAVLLLQTVRKDWKGVRWGFLIRVCEKWINHLGDDTLLEGTVDAVEAGSAAAEGFWEEQDDAKWLWKMGKPGQQSQRPGSLRRRHSEV